MSYWAHVNASIRIDALRFEGVPKIDFDKLLIVSTYEEPNPQCNMPCGSEGSLEWSLWENPSKSSLSSYTLSIFGDLRDYESDELPKVLEWWNGLMKKFSVRQAILQIEFEDYEWCYVFDAKGREIAKYDAYGNRTKEEEKAQKEKK